MDTHNTPLAEKVRTHAVELLTLLHRYRRFVAGLSPCRESIGLTKEADELIAKCTGVNTHENTVNNSTCNGHTNHYLHTFADTPRG